MQPYPIVYIRGYAMTQREVEATFNSPFYGFELGSTQYKLGSDAKPDMHIFESPLVRLLERERYVNAFNRYVSAFNEPIPNSVPTDPSDEWRRTLWIFRFYDREAQLLGGQKRPKIDDYAERLAIFLDKVRAACGRDRKDQTFKVNLVAHSMGGLVARCYLQNPYLFQSPPEELRDVYKERPDLAGITPVAVNALFTYGTPHKGISFRHGLGWVEDLRDLVGYAGSDTFGPEEMRRFLNLSDPNDDLHTYRPREWAPSEEKVFCLIGTNYKDYVIYVSKHSVGPASDGLVAIENAYTKNSCRAFVHRSHSGPFGLVNSEEGYQNLIRFLLGDVRCEVSLAPFEITRDLPLTDKNDKLDFLEINVDVVIRGLPTYLNTRRELDNSSIIVRMKQKPGMDGHYIQEDPAPIHLFTAFLRKPKTQHLNEKGEPDPYLRTAVQLRIIPHYKHSGHFRDSRFEGESILNDRIHLAVPRDLKLDGVLYRWGEEGNVDLGSPIPPQSIQDGREFQFPLAKTCKDFICCDGIIVRTFPWK